MYLLAGASIPAYGTETGGGLSGRTVLPVPFIISGGISIMGTDSVTGICALKTSLSYSEAVEIFLGSAEVITGSIDLPCSLSAMDSDTDTYIILSALSHSETSGLLNELSEKISGMVEILTSLSQSRLTGVYGISTALGGMSGHIGMNLPMSTGYLNADTLKVFADGKDITCRLTSAEIDLSGVPTVSAVFLPHTYGIAQLSFFINDEEFTFETVSSVQSAASTQINGRMAISSAKTALNIKGMKASDIALSYSDRIVWAAKDYVAVNISGDYTSYDLAELLADGTGLNMCQLPNGYICISGDGTDITITPEHVFIWELSGNEQKYSSVTVTYGTGDVYIETDSRAYIGGTASIKVYGASADSVFSDAEIKLVKSGMTETVTEAVYFTDGEAQITKPPVNILTAGITNNGRTIYKDGVYGYVTVSYTAIYDEYSAVSTSEGKRSVTVFSDNSVTVLTGADGDALKVSSPNIADRVSAIRKAHSLLTPRTSATLTTSRNQALTLPSGIVIKSPYINGRLRSAKISIKTNPLIINDILEVEA